jgi:AraC-like DNA-binding protein
MLNQSFHFEKPQDIVAWQFNREFYCIVNHDAEVGCVGFLFFGPEPTMMIKTDQKLQQSLQLLLDMFTEEFESDDNIQGEMLRLLLAKLIIKLTREGRKQFMSSKPGDDLHFHLIRQFNLLVEAHFRKEHSVKFYADKLNKSPKTISNVFAKHSSKSPLEFIQQRIITEAKRLFYYTDKSAKEIDTELGFSDAAHFSKFFKNLTNQNPSSLKSKSITG